MHAHMIVHTLLGDEPSTKRASLYKINKEKDIVKNIKINIFMHYIDYSKELVNKSFGLKARLISIQEDTQLSKEEKKMSKRNTSIEIRQVKDDLLSPLWTNYRCGEQYHS